MTRHLQSRLAVANFKTQRGWQNLTLDTIEPKIDQDLKQKRKNNAEDTISSSSSGHDNNDTKAKTSRRRVSQASIDSSTQHRNKRARTAGFEPSQQIIHGLDGRNKETTTTTRQNPVKHKINKHRSWKETHKLPQSSPPYHRFDPGQNYARSPDREEFSPVMGAFPPHQTFHSSPPRTPPHRTLTNPASSAIKPSVGEDGADLLLYLATSPSPAARLTRNKVTLEPEPQPATPPYKSIGLPSTLLTTPGGGPQTPGNLFNFHDFVHITPSPAQTTWNQSGTGGRSASRTPLTMPSRRKLNFDGIVPPSPANGNVTGGSLSRSVSGLSTITGLGMDLGGELSQSSTF